MTFSSFPSGRQHSPVPAGREERHSPLPLPGSLPRSTPTRSRDLGNSRLVFCFGARAGSVGVMFWIRVGKGLFLSAEHTVYGIALGFAFLPWEHWVTGISVNTHFCLFDSLLNVNKHSGSWMCVDIYMRCVYTYIGMHRLPLYLVCYLGAGRAWEERQEEGKQLGATVTSPAQRLERV